MSQVVSQVVSEVVSEVVSLEHDCAAGPLRSCNINLVSVRTNARVRTPSGAGIDSHRSMRDRRDWLTVISWMPARPTKRLRISQTRDIL